MEGEDKSSSCLVRPCPEIENRSGDGIDCEPIAKMDDSQLVGGDDPSSLTVDSAAAGGEAAAHAAVVVDVKTEVNVDEEGGAKKKRGRPPRGQTRPPPIKKMKEEEEEEDVCFICFDGGSLVLCDRRGCPKAYHPACIKRDEAFFRSKAKWNCGWHICSICQKAAHYMCYTCTYSLCKACTKKADYLAVRENKGFCITCMRTIMLIENNDQGNKEMPQVDFDDKSSWEYLFKVYWIYLKEKLSLTVEELVQAKNPWKAASAVACNKSLKMRYGGDNNQVSSSSFNISVGHQESNDSKRRTTEQPKLPNNGDSPPTSKSSCNQGNTSSESTEWASEDLLEFVAHMKNGDTSVLSQFDVQTLLLDYIKRNNLRDPSRKSQIICDFRLKNLFGRPRVGHFEMLKLLEFHFSIKEDFKKDVQGNIIDGVLSQVEVGGNNENLLMTGKERKHKTRTKVEERGPQVNLDEYAAIDVHNINLIYLRRNLMESLVVDSGKFHEKVVGSIVRIRISNNDQKQDMYRLVQVVGTSKAALPYKIGEKTADFGLEILNLDKKETISIDVISNQAFSEDECRRLRQSIKCGLVKRLTVGQVKEKAVALQEVRLNDWLETEVLRLNHLRDRASEKGHKKGLRECIEKLELLKTPEERHRRLREIPEVHADPNMDPNCDSDQDSREIDNKKQGDNLKPRYSGFGRKRRESISAQTGDSKNNSATGLWKKLNTCGQNRSLPTKFYLENGAPSRVVQRAHDSHYKGKDSCASNGLEKPGNRIDSCGSVGGGRNNQAVLRSESFRVRAPETSILSLSAASAPSANDSETDKLWHYRDPNGKIQGPFCVVQLRKWSTTGYFPPEMRIWCTNNEEVDSILLTDLLSGKLCKVFPLQSNNSLRSKGVIAPRDGRLYCFDDRSCGSVNTTDMEGSKVLAPYACNNESVISDGWGSQSSNWTAPVNKTDGHTGSSSQSLDSLKFNNVYSDHLQANCPLGQQDGTSLHQGKGREEKMCSSASNLGNGTSHESTTFQTSEASRENQSDGQGYPGQSSGVNWRPLPINLSSKNGDSHSGFSSVARSSDSSEPKLEIDIPNLPSPTPKTSNGDLEGQAIKAEPSAPLSLPVQDSGLHNLPSPTPELSGDEKADSNMQNLPSPPLNLGDGDKKTEAAENKQPASSKCPVQESGSSWSSASSLVVGGERQCRETADEWSGCSPARAKPSVEEGDSGLGSVTSLKPPELANDHAATPTSKCDQLTPPSPPHPVFNESTWRLEPIEFSTLDEESVSDLLAEVDAMESQCGLASPTSIMYSDDELFQDPNDNCFNSIGVLSHPLDSGKGDALSSTGDITIPCQFTMTGEPLCAAQAQAQAQAQAIDHVKRSCVKSSTTFEVYVEKQPTYFSANKTEAGPNREPDTSQRAEQKPMNTIWGTAQGNMNLGLGGINNVGWGAGLETTLGNENMNWSTSAGFMGSESFPLHGGEKFVGPSDWESTWRRQSIHGDGGFGGESYFRTPPKGQRVCKFYENGNCPRGSFCDHFHP